MRKTFGLSVVLAAVFTFVSVGTASAQGLFGAGVSFLHNGDAEETAKGLTIDYAGTARSTETLNVSWVGDLGLYNVEGSRGLSVMAGVRVAPKTTPKIGYFGQFLAGIFRSSATGITADLCDEFDLECSTTDLAFAPGFGVNIPVSPRVNVRAQLDLFFIQTEGESTNAQRFWFGIALPVGE